MRIVVYLWCAWFAVGVSQALSIDDKAFVVESVSRTLDLSTQIVKETVTVTVERKGGAVDFFIALVRDKAGRLAHVKATHDDAVLKVEVTEVPEKRNLKFIKVTLPENLTKLRFVVNAMYTGMLKPYPTLIRQKDKQLMVYQDSHYVYLPYAVKKQKLMVKLFNDNVPESYSKRIKPVERSGRTITYGPYSDVAAYTTELLRVHFESNAPFLVATKHTRLIEVSHWGNVAVEEQLEILHAGAVLKGSFSRLDYQRDYREGRPSIAKFTMTLPAGAHDIYYRDEIGNISTSTVRPASDAVKLIIQPRFPLFGGWKTTFNVGYNVPSQEFLMNAGSRFCLKMKLIDRIYDEFVSENFVLKVILPETATDVDFKAPYDVERDELQRHFTYLDTVGRPTLVIRKKNMVPAHLQDFQLCYTWQRFKLLREPFMVSSAVFILLLSVIFIVRLDFSLSKDPHEESQLMLDGLADKISDLQNKRNCAYEQWIDAINAYCTLKDADALAAARKKTDQELKTVAQQMSALQAECKFLKADVIEKIASVQRSDRSARELLNNWKQEAERYVVGKINRQAYSERSTALQSKLTDIREKNAQLLQGI